MMKQYLLHPTKQKIGNLLDGIEDPALFGFINKSW